MSRDTCGVLHVGEYFENLSFSRPVCRSVFSKVKVLTYLQLPG